MSNFFTDIGGPIDPSNLKVHLSGLNYDIIVENDRGVSSHYQKNRVENTKSFMMYMREFFFEGNIDEDLLTTDAEMTYVTKESAKILQIMKYDEIIKIIDLFNYHYNRLGITFNFEDVDYCFDYIQERCHAFYDVRLYEPVVYRDFDDGGLT